MPQMIVLVFLFFIAGVVCGLINGCCKRTYAKMCLRFQARQVEYGVLPSTKVDAKEGHSNGQEDDGVESIRQTSSQATES